MSPACNGVVVIKTPHATAAQFERQQQQPGAPALHQLQAQPSKRTRIELLGAQNDHNYTSFSRGRPALNECAISNGAHPSHLQQNANSSSSNSNNNNGRMDDCTAAMVLMFLSSRPGEEAREHNKVEAAAAAGAGTSGQSPPGSGRPASVAGSNKEEDVRNNCKPTASSAGGPLANKFAIMKRNSEPIEMNLDGRSNGHTQRLKHFKRRLPASSESDFEDEPAEAPKATRENTAITQPKTRTTGKESHLRPTQKEAQRPAAAAAAAAAKPRAISAKQPTRLSDECDFDEEEEEEDEEEEEETELAFVEAPRRSRGQLDDEMIFELQQVDQVELATANETISQRDRGNKELDGSERTKLNTGSSREANGAVRNSAQQQQQHNQVSSACSSGSGSGSSNKDESSTRGLEKAPPTPPPLPTGRQMMAASKQQSELEQQRKQSQQEQEQEQQPQQQHFEGAAAEPRTTIQTLESEPSARRAGLSGRRQADELGKLVSFELIAKHHQPVETRTIFSCMWPSCPKNCDSLDDIERHVRAHLGPNSIGDEDFYYEETEVDEPTYLAIFGHSSGQQPASCALSSGLQRRAHAHHELNLAAAAAHQLEHHQLHHNHNHHHHHHSHNHHNHQALPLSPSHNSDGLSSGHSFASSSPATSPVCSADSSSALSTSSLSSSASSAGFLHLEAGPAGGQLGGPAGELLNSSKTSAATAACNGQQLMAGANSLDWSHFLTGLPRNWTRDSAAAGSLSKQPNQATHFQASPKLRHQPHLQHQHQTAAFNLEAMLANSPRLSSSLKAGRRGAPAKLGAMRQHATGSQRARRKAHQVQEQLRASIIEQLNQRHSQRAGGGSGGGSFSTGGQQQQQHNLQFSMQLTGSSPHFESAALGLDSGPRGALYASRPQQRQQQQRKFTYAKPNLDHSYGSSPPPSQLSSNCNSTKQHQDQQQQQQQQQQLKPKRGRRPPARLAEQADEVTRAAGSGAKQTAARRPKLFQHGDADHKFYSLAHATDFAAHNKQAHLSARQSPLPAADLCSPLNNLSSGSSGGPAGLKRVRGENRKCRKVYGMERRDQWCTQCKWKKACSRFCDQQQ